MGGRCWRSREEERCNGELYKLRMGFQPDVPACCYNGVEERDAGRENCYLAYEQHERFGKQSKFSTSKLKQKGNEIEHAIKVLSFLLKR